MTTLTLSHSPIVSEKAGRATTNSRDVAAYFGKQHKNVLQSIANLECSEEFRVLNFQHTPYIDEQNGQTYTMVDMTKDGFIFLAFSFTGKKAAQLKEAYINRFNEMEKTIEDKEHPALAAPKLAQAHSEIISLQGEIAYLRGQMKTLFVWMDKLIMEGRRP